MARPIARLKLGYYPLPFEEAQNIRSLLVSEAPYAAMDPCAGDGTALLELAKYTDAHLAGIELDSEEDGTGVPGTLRSLGDQRGCPCIRGSSSRRRNVCASTYKPV